MSSPRIVALLDPATRKYGRVPLLKTTIEIPDELLRRAKASAARQGRSLKDVLTAALSEHLAASPQAPPGKEPWRAVFGKADPSMVRAVDRVVAEELEQIEAETWR